MDDDERKEYRRVYEKSWRQKNIEKVRESKRLWAKEHPEQVKEIRNAPHRKAHAKEYNRNYFQDMPEIVRKRNIIRHAKYGAIKRNLEFSITFNDIMWNEYCPVFGIKLNYGKSDRGKKTYDRASIDRTDSTKGYVPGNVVVMSWRANMLKRDGTAEEMKMIAEYLAKMEKKNG